MQLRQQGFLPLFGPAFNPVESAGCRKILCIYVYSHCQSVYAMAANKAMQRKTLSGMSFCRCEESREAKFFSARVHYFMQMYKEVLFFSWNSAVAYTQLITIFLLTCTKDKCYKKLNFRFYPTKILVLRKGVLK